MVLAHLKGMLWLGNKEAIIGNIPCNKADIRSIDWVRSSF
jgi:hypothetical protein